MIIVFTVSYINSTKGLILGTAAKMFTIAGPVIVYGTAASFKWTMALPELYIPSTVDTISAEAFWISGVRHFELPKKMTNIANYGICYPQFKGGIWAEPTAQSPEMVAELTEIMAKYQFDKNYQNVSYFGDSLNVQGAAFAYSGNYQVGSTIRITTREDTRNSVFAGKSGPFVINNSMNIQEVIARLQVAFDHILVTSSDTENDVMSVINDAIHTTTVTSLIIIQVQVQIRQYYGMIRFVDYMINIL